MDVCTLKRARDRLLLERSRALFAFQEAQNQVKEARESLESAEIAQNVLQNVAEQVQRLTHDRLSGLVTSCLRAIFGDDAYSFTIEFEKKRGRTEAVLRFTKQGEEIDPMSASGGGVIDVASFALRVAALLLSKPPLRRVLCLDEPWKHLSADYRPKVRVLVEKLSEELGVQFLIVTHSSDFEMGEVVEL